MKQTASNIIGFSLVVISYIWRVSSYPAALYLILHGLYLADVQKDKQMAVVEISWGILLPWFVHFITGYLIKLSRWFRTTWALPSGALSSVPCVHAPQSEGKMFQDGQKALAAAIVFAVIVLAWLFRYEDTGAISIHRNRITGAMCHVTQSCWFNHGEGIQ